MLLAIDVGNTNTVLGLFDGEQLLRSYRVKTDARSTADEILLTFRGLLRDDPTVSGISLCSTVPAVLNEMRTMLDRYYQDVPHVIEPAAGADRVSFHSSASRTTAPVASSARYRCRSVGRPVSPSAATTCERSTSPR